MSCVARVRLGVAIIAVILTVILAILPPVGCTTTTHHREVVAATNTRTHHHHHHHQQQQQQQQQVNDDDDGDAARTTNAIFERFVFGGNKVRQPAKRSPIARHDKTVNTDNQDNFDDLVSGYHTSTDASNVSGRHDAHTDSHDNGSHEDHEEDHDHHGIHVASWRWDYVQTPFIYTFFVVLAGMCKVGFHHADVLSSLLPESCLLILLGTVVGGIVYLTGSHDVIPNFESRTFFLFLLPPIMLESAYSLHDRAFADNLGTVLLYAVVGTLINCFTIGPTLYGLASLGAVGEINIDFVEALVYSALISAVDPVAVLAIFQEVGVNKDLYFLVFGESLLNDAVTVVLYTMMVAFTTMQTITADQVGLGVAAFFCVSVGGLAIGLIFGILTALITRVTEEVRVVEPLAMLGMAYLSYLTAEMVHFSGIISIIGCGLVQAQYAIANISSKSYTTVKYFSKMLSATCDCIIFFFLGMVLINDKHIWHTGFVLWTLFLCLLYRFISVFSLTAVVNHSEKIRYIDYEEQFIMAYGGLRGAVCFSLVIMLDEKLIPNKDLFVTATLVVILFTVFIQGSTIKPIVKWLEISIHKEVDLSLTVEINSTLIDHVMGGVEEIAGERGENYLKLMIYRYDEKYLKKWLQRKDASDSKINRVFEKLTIQDHYAHLYGPAAQKDEEKQIVLQTTCAPALIDDMLIATEPEPTVPLVPLPKKEPPAPKPAPVAPAAPQPMMMNPFGTALMDAEKGRKGKKGKKVSSIAATLVSVGQTVASPLMMDNMQATQTLRKALRANNFNKFHMKYNPNLIRDDEQELGEQLRLRRLRARRLTMAALSPTTSNQGSRVDLSQIASDPEMDGNVPLHGGVHNDRSRSQSLAATTEILAERARQRRKQHLVKSHTVEGDGHQPAGGAGTPVHRQVAFLRNGGVSPTSSSSATDDAQRARHSTGELELRSLSQQLEPIHESENGDDHHHHHRTEGGEEGPIASSSGQTGSSHDDHGADESSPFLQFSGDGDANDRRQRLHKEHKVDVDDSETTV